LIRRSPIRAFVFGDEPVVLPPAVATRPTLRNVVRAMQLTSIVVRLLAARPAEVR
jgi:hypothetical protein